MKTTRMRHRAIAAVVTLFAVAAIGNCAIILNTDFDGIAPGTVTSAQLNGATTGGSWTINTGRDPNLTTIENNGGNHALLFDDDNFGNGGTQLFASLNLTSPIDVSEATSSLIFELATAPRRTGPNKGLRYSFNSAAGDAAAYLDWNDIGGFGDPIDELYLNGVLISNLPVFSFLFPWDPADVAVRNATIIFSNGAVSIDFGGVTAGPVPLLNGVTAIGQFQTFSLGSEIAGAKGIFLDNVQASLVPEPSTVCLMAFIMTALFAFYRNGNSQTKERS